MNPLQYIKWSLINYFSVKGRADRSEFLIFMVFVSFVGVLAATIDFKIFGPEVFPTTQEILHGQTMPSYFGLTHMVGLAFFIPSITVTTRRLHDRGKTGWWQLSYITVIGVLVVFVWCLYASSPFANKYGPPSAYEQA